MSTVQTYDLRGFCNEDGIPRLYQVRSFFLTEDNPLDIDELVWLYQTWRDLSEFMVLERCEWNQQEFSMDVKRIGVKCAKRGNDVHRWRVKQRLDWMDKIPDVEFFSPGDLNAGKECYTQVLFFTLTYDTNRCSRAEAWLNIGVEYNRWISGMRFKYGRIDVFRTYQGFGSGYPHIHGVAYFRDHKFKVFSHKDVDGETRYRVYQKYNFEAYYHSFIDVQACYSTQGALSYCRRYATRQNSGSHGGAMQDDGSYSDLDMALMWLFRKRSWAISGQFRERYSDLIRQMHISKAVQVNLDGNPVLKKVTWNFIGIFPASRLKIDPFVWVHDVTDNEMWA